MRPPAQLAGTCERLELQRKPVPGIHLLVCLRPSGSSSRRPGFAQCPSFWLCQSYANVALGQPCSPDSTDYISPGPNGQEFITTITRHNCRTPQLFCNLASLVCEPTKPLGSQCSYDQECRSVRTISSVTKGRVSFLRLIPSKYNCEYQSKTCILPPEDARGVPVWEYTLIIIVVFLSEYPNPLTPNVSEIPNRRC